MDRIVDLADGNPFFVEELVALDDAMLPSRLRDVLGARLDRLDDATLRVLREAAVIGRRVDADLLAAISDTTRNAVDTALRTAVEANLVVSDADGRHYRFRHALLREAVYDAILPADRIAAHRRVAEAIASDPQFVDPIPSVAAADLARHWTAARAEPEAFIAQVRAGQAARSVGAWHEAGDAFEEALVRWDRVPDPTVADVTRSRLLEEASLMAWYAGDVRRAIALNERAEAEPDILADPSRHGMLLSFRSDLAREMGESGRASDLAARAAELVPPEPPTLERAHVLAGVAIYEQLDGRLARSIATFEASVAIARTTTEDWQRFGALPFLAAAYAEAGRAAEAVEILELARSAHESAVVDGHFFAFTTNAPWVWLGLGDYEACLEEADRSLRLYERYALESAGITWLTAPRAEAAFRLGRWDEALRTIVAGRQFESAPGPASTQAAVMARILAGRGEFEQARATVLEATRLAPHGQLLEVTLATAAAAFVAIVAGDAAGAADAVRGWLATSFHTDSVAILAEVAWPAAWAAAMAATPGPTGTDDLVDFVDRTLASQRLSGPYRDAVDPSFDLATAWLARRSGQDDPARWAAAAAELERTGYLPLALLARGAEAEAWLGADARSNAEAALRAGMAHATSMGAPAMSRHLEQVAAAGRIDLALPDEADALQPAPPAPDPWGLSPREREVLALLTDGRTNVQIGEALYISDKTASVHVTHILDKMGVSSRVEAALMAVRAGIER